MSNVKNSTNMYKLPKIPKRDKYSHKSDFGKYLVWATSLGSVGCGYFVARSIYLSGGGYVKLLTPSENYSILATLTPETVFFVYENEEEKEQIMKRELPNCDYLICGPGIGINDFNKNLIKYILGNFSKSIIFDADALKLISDRQFHTNIIITPHEGEFSVLSGFSIEQIRKDREKLAVEFAAKYNVICVLKGFNTIVTDGKRTYINKTGGPHLAKAGTGDVLTGIIGGFLGLKIEPFDAACLGVYIHGFAGDLVKKKLGEYSLIPDDLLQILPLAIAKYLKK